jgi:hypothetical protein
LAALSAGSATGAINSYIGESAEKTTESDLRVAHRGIAVL